MSSSCNPLRERWHRPGILAFSLFLITSTCGAQDVPRNLSGLVADRHREPLRGAIVQVQDENTLAVISYITDATGTFVFKRLRGDTDYQVWATYRGQRSKTKELSHFSSSDHPTMRLIIRPQ